MRFATLLIFCAATARASATKFYMDFEHPKVAYRNPKYYAYANFTSQRYSRRDPVQYMSAHCEILMDFGNNIQGDVYMYEFLSNEYRRSFVEFHYKICDFMEKEKYFFPLLLQFFPVKTCPIPKGKYHFVNMSFPDMPFLRTFPFSKGRFFLNLSDSRTRERALEAYIDLVIIEKLH